MKTLHLTLKKKWFDMIASGEKKEEYREVKFFWADRLMCGWPSRYGYIEKLNPDFKQFDAVKFVNGGNFHSKHPSLTVKLDGIEIRTGNPEWGAEVGKEYFVIKLGEIIKH